MNQKKIHRPARAYNTTKPLSPADPFSPLRKIKKIKGYQKTKQNPKPNLVLTTLTLDHQIPMSNI